MGRTPKEHSMAGTSAPVATSRIRFRFGVRALLWLTIVTALALAWWRDHRELSWRLDLRERQIRQLHARLERQGQPQRTIGLVFASPQHLAQFVDAAEERDFKNKNWSTLGYSELGDDSLGPLTELLQAKN